MPTKQETFDTVAKHLLKQGREATNEEGECKYLTKDGLMCAAGCLIPRDKYKESFEGHIIGEYYDGEFDFSPAELLKSLGHDISLVIELQWVHDCKPLSHWPTNLVSLAKEHGLSHKVVDDYLANNSEDDDGD